MTNRSRRRFLLGAAAAVAPFVSTSIARAKAAASQKKVGFAICGLGSLSEHQIAPAFASTRHCRLTGLVTSTPAKAEDFRSEYDIPTRSVYSDDDMHRMADNPDIDVVYVVTPNSLHAPHTIAAA